MPEIIVDGIQIDFPFEPYPCQLEYMSKVIEALKDGKHAILESPTGTGKTLCLLCATLAWQSHLQRLTESTVDEIVTHFRGNQKQYWKKPSNNTQPNAKKANLIPKIIYSSRTHSQLGQCINALKKSPYSDRKIGMIASREQLCINPKVMNLDTNSAKIYGCKTRVKSRSCHFYNRFEQTRESLKSETIMGDIEDLMKIGKQKTICPYFLSREMLEDADITFMPYNYLLDSRIRRLYNIDLSNNIIIFDEAHNIEQVCEDNASVELTSANLSSCIEELKSLGEHLYEIASTGEGSNNLSKVTENDKVPEEIPDLIEILALKSYLLNLETNFHKIDIGKEKEGLTKGVDFLFDLLKICGLYHGNKTQILELIDLASSFIGMSGEPKLHAIGVKGLEKVGSFLKTVFHDDIENGDLENLQTSLANYYKVYVQDKEISTPFGKSNKVSWDSNKKSEAVTKNRVLSYWCLSPGRTMKELSNCGVRSIILTSGTLYPIETLKMDMDINIGVELQNRHVINSDQMLVTVCTKGPDGETLNSSYESREKMEYTNSLGNVLVNLARLIPRGLLVVFPSYGMMKKCIARWESCDIYNSVMQHKQLIVEPQDKVQFSAAMSQFHSKNADPSSVKGAVLLAVARGKVSEGIDLSDHQGRGVIIIGLPYPAMMEPRIRLKMCFLDERIHLVKHGITGRVWYKQQAYRAVNQSVGRVIRHNRDFGAVYLCDERFATTDSRSQLPQWLQPNIKICNTFGDVVRNTVQFFKSVVMKYPPPSLGYGEVMPNFSQGITSEKIPSNAHNSSIVHREHELSSTQVPASSPAFQPISEDMFHFFEAYTDSTSHSTKDSNEESLSLMEILRNAEKQKAPPPSSPIKRSTSALKLVDTSECPPRKVKRYRLVLYKEPEETMESPEYLKIIAKLFANDSDGFRNYKNAVQSFKETRNVDMLFSCLSSLLGDKDQPGLVRDFHKFIVSDHQERFNELCKSVLGLDCIVDKENDHKELIDITSPFDCAHCRASPSIVPLGAPCKHICCMACWKIILDSDQGTKKCPKCAKLVRKRHLVKINFN